MGTSARILKVLGGAGMSADEQDPDAARHPHRGGGKVLECTPDSR